MLISPPFGQNQLLLSQDCNLRSRLTISLISLLLSLVVHEKVCTKNTRHHSICRIFRIILHCKVVLSTCSSADSPSEILCQLPDIGQCILLCTPHSSNRCSIMLKLVSRQFVILTAVLQPNSNKNWRQSFVPVSIIIRHDGLNFRPKYAI